MATLPITTQLRIVFRLQLIVAHSNSPEVCMDGLCIECVYDFRLNKTVHKILEALLK